MCLAINKNLLLVLYDAPKRILCTNSRSFGQPKNDAKTLYFHAILGSTSTVIHSVKQRLLRNRPGNDAATSCDFLRERLRRAITITITHKKPSFTEPPNKQQAC